MQEINKNTNKYCFGVEHTMNALAVGAVETLIVYEDLQLQRIVTENKSTNKRKENYLTQQEMKEHKTFDDVIENVDYLEWLADNYQNFGTTLEFVSDRSQEGAQFAKGFSGIGGLLRWPIDFTEMDDDEYNDENNNNNNNNNNNKENNDNDNECDAN